MTTHYGKCVFAVKINARMIIKKMFKVFLFLLVLSTRLAACLSATVARYGLKTREYLQKVYLLYPYIETCLNKISKLNSVEKDLKEHVVIMKFI